MALVAGDHETGVVILVGDTEVGLVLTEELHDVQATLEAGGPQRGGVGPRDVVHVSPGLHQGLY